MSENNHQISFNSYKYGKRASGFSGDESCDDSMDVDNGKIEQLTPENKFEKKQTLAERFHFTFNEIICIANILASTLGIGLFTFPYILYEIGVINSLFIFLLVSISVYYTLDLLRSFVVDSKLFSYSSITHTTLGPCWLKVYAIFTFFFYMTGIINYLNTIFSLLSGMLDLLNNKVVKVFYFLLTYSLEVVLCLFLSNVSKIYILSFIAFIAFLIILFTVIIKGIVFLSTNNDRFKYFSFFSFRDSSSSWDKFLLLMSEIIEIYYGFIYHSTFPTLLSGLDNLKVDNTKRIHITSYTIISVIYALFSFFGFFCINDDNYTFKELFVNGKDLKDNNALICIFKIILILFFVSLIPMRYLVIRDNYISIIGHEMLPIKVEIIITSICLFITNIIVYFADFDNLISTIILIFGGFFGVFIGFVLPVINYVAINGKTKIRSIIGYFLAIIFVTVGFFSIFYNFKNKDNKEKL